MLTSRMLWQRLKYAQWRLYQIVLDGKVDSITHWESMIDYYCDEIMHQAMNG